jgi:hypothetical protein
MNRPEKIAGHDVGNNGEQHQKNRDPENPTVMHSPPTWRVRMTVVILAPMVSIVHRKQAKHITGTDSFENEKGRSGLPVPSRTGGFMTAQQISISLSG